MSETEGGAMQSCEMCGQESGACYLAASRSGARRTVRVTTVLGTTRTGKKMRLCQRCLLNHWRPVAAEARQLQAARVRAQRRAEQAREKVARLEQLGQQRLPLGEALR